MQPQQQTVVTSAGPVLQPVYISQPYQTASVVNSYAHRQSMIIGILLIVGGSLSIIFNIVDLAVGIDYWYWYAYDDLSHISNGVAGHGIWAGILVSILLCSHDYYCRISQKRKAISSISIRPYRFRLFSV